MNSTKPDGHKIALLIDADSQRFKGAEVFSFGPKPFANACSLFLHVEKLGDERELGRG